MRRFAPAGVHRPCGFAGTKSERRLRGTAAETAVARLGERLCAEPDQLGCRRERRRRDPLESTLALVVLAAAPPGRLTEAQGARSRRSRRPSATARRFPAAARRRRSVRPADRPPVIRRGQPGPQAPRSARIRAPERGSRGVLPCPPLRSGPPCALAAGRRDAGRRAGAHGPTREPCTQRVHPQTRQATPSAGGRPESASRDELSARGSARRLVILTPRSCEAAQSRHGCDRRDHP